MPAHSMAAVWSSLGVNNLSRCMSTIVFMSLSSKQMHIYMYLKLKH